MGTRTRRGCGELLSGKLGLSSCDVAGGQRMGKGNPSDLVPSGVFEICVPLSCSGRAPCSGGA